MAVLGKPFTLEAFVARVQELLDAPAALAR